MPKKQTATTLNLPLHLVVFQYADAPDEWHAMDLETSAFGSGKNLREALVGLGKTLEGQFEELVRRGNVALVTPNPDPEWVRAYKERKHPAFERVRILFCGQCTVPISIASGKAKAEVPTTINLNPSLSESNLQPA